MALPKSDFFNVVKNTPLISIDLIIRDPSGAILMGWRNNEPAKNTWFVPGGCIHKNERISDAFERIMRTEIALEIPFREARFVGAFEHFYSTNCFGDPGFGTHYCVLAHALRLDYRPNIKVDSQHSKFDWLTSSSTDVHPHSRVYFDPLYDDEAEISATAGVRAETGGKF
jgi:colanic acid biosynthesis protein WcaH